MTEDIPARFKRMGARFFKNPPQPYMCIRDTLVGSTDPCYVNVLSWDKVAFSVSANNVSLYGGMKLCPSRIEKKDVPVFAVMAHPEVLKQHGKNTHNPMERTWLIDVLLDFVEAMNKGIVFSRCYRVLVDRDITGELKEIWMAVQADRAKNQQGTSSDGTRTIVPQYSLYQTQDQAQQHLLLPRQQYQQGQKHPQEKQPTQPLRIYSGPHWNDNNHQIIVDDQRSNFRYGPQFQNRPRVVPHSTPNKYPPGLLQNNYYESNGRVVPLNTHIQQQQQPRQQAYGHEEHTRQTPQYFVAPSTYYHPDTNNALRSATWKMVDGRYLFSNK
ncbi:uncharacterized protein [Venturia canescens]|uniref:uncharacterized protein n=1 Tax=Venturia canescens TaxID=32260 RepID=UPI001C9C81F3|nr:uncharacterized protein LOC122409574 [Venturia canescens]XP_043273184.1 uncharacterized protein LOC122409574 [Venturia canescens]